jgi:glutathione S-transferase
MGGKYVLNYFPLMARGEAARVMFHLKGVEFTDNQIPFHEWPQQKGDHKRFPLGQMPTLEVDGEIICQSSAIFSYLAHEFDLYGSTGKEKSIIDQVRETIRDSFDGFSKIRWDKTLDEGAKKEAMLKFFQEAKTKLLMQFLADQSKKIEGKFFLGDKISVADVIYFVAHEYVVNSYPAATQEYPDLVALHKNVGEIESIK